MTALLVSIGVVLVMLGIPVIILGLVQHFFPSTQQYIPEGWHKYMSLQYGGYYLLAGLVLILVF